MNFGITGPTRLTADQSRFVAEAVRKRLSPGDIMVSGCAFGVDTVGVEVALSIGLRVILTIPTGKFYNTDLEALARAPQHDIEVVPVTGGYMLRNDATVQRTDVLLAFPPTAEEELRSGTWATVRRAYKWERMVEIRPLPGGRKGQK